MAKRKTDPKPIIAAARIHFNEKVYAALRKYQTGRIPVLDPVVTGHLNAQLTWVLDQAVIAADGLLKEARNGKA